MTEYTKLNQGQILKILNPYGFKNIASFRLLSGGSENTNYWIKTDIQDIVLTVCEQKSLNKTKELAFLLDYLASNNFATSKALKRIDGETISLWQNKPVMVKAFIEGDILDGFSNGLLTYLGRELAKLHNLKAPKYLPKTLSYGIEKFDEVEVYSANSTFCDWLEKTRKFIESFITAELPKTLIHSDIFANNIVVSKDGRHGVIMDFEEASYYYRVFDIGMMLVGTCCDGDKLSLTKAGKLLSGYRQKVELSHAELEALQAFTVYGATATAFWRHQNFNFVNPNREMKDHYRAMKNLADNVMGIPSDQFRRLSRLEKN